MIILAGLARGRDPVRFLTYRLVLHRVPIKLMDGAEKRLLSIRKTGPNTFHHGRAPTHTSRQIVMPSPDLVYSSCVYDLAAGDLVIAGELPPEGHYWSLSLYAHNTDNYFVLNDRELPARSFAIVVRGERRAVACGRDDRRKPDTDRDCADPHDPAQGRTICRSFRPRSSRSAAAS